MGFWYYFPACIAFVWAVGMQYGIWVRGRLDIDVRKGTRVAVGTILWLSVVTLAYGAAVDLGLIGRH